MHIVVMVDPKEQTKENVQSIAKLLGVTAFEVQQRMIGGTPAVLATFSDLEQAQSLASKLNQIQVPALIVDASEVRNRTGGIFVHRFEFKESSLVIETVDQKRGDIPYDRIESLVPGMSMLTHSETKTTTERKFSLGKTLIAGGIPMTKKVEKKIEVDAVAYTKALYVYLNGRKQPVIFVQDDMVYHGLGSAMQSSQGLNFAHLIGELHRRCPKAAFDDRLLKRIGAVRLLGPTLNPDTNLDLAVEILARSLRESSQRTGTNPD